MAKVKFKSIALFTGSIFTLLFFHFVPVGLGSVTIMGKQNAETAMEATEENTAGAKVSQQLVFEPRAGQPLLEPMVTCSFGAHSSCSSGSNFSLQELK